MGKMSASSGTETGTVYSKGVRKTLRLLFMNPRWKIVRSPKSRDVQLEGEPMSPQILKRMIAHKLVTEVFSNDAGWTHFKLSDLGKITAGGPLTRRKRKKREKKAAVNRPKVNLTHQEETLAQSEISDLSRGEVLALGNMIHPANLQFRSIQTMEYHFKNHNYHVIVSIIQGDSITITPHAVHGKTLKRLIDRGVIFQVPKSEWEALSDGARYKLTTLGKALAKVIYNWEGRKTPPPTRATNSRRVNHAWHQNHDNHVRELFKGGSSKSDIARLKGVALSTIRRVLDS